jgi:hypothetical protein
MLECRKQARVLGGCVVKSLQVSLRLTIPGIIILGISVGYAQSNLASVSGVVSDPQGAVVPAAALAATNTATGVETKTATDSAGFYAIRNLPVGIYTVSIERRGFRRYVRQGIILTTGQSLGLDAQLELGKDNQATKVTGAAPLLETRTSDISNLVTSSSVEALPLANRRSLNLIQLSGAAVFVGYNVALNATPSFSLAGGRTGTSMAWLDGADVQNIRLGAGMITIDLPVDAIQEVKVLENNCSAEYGGSAGGAIVETTKSGTNRFHGSTYEFFRNDALDAAGFFAPVQNDAKLKPKLRYNVFGVTLGGPVQHDRSFFFFAYEGNFLRQGMPETLTVPTVLQREGDFSRTFNTRGELIPIYDPATTRVDNGGIVREQFPGNVIPPDRIDPVAAKVMEFYPLPNQPSSNSAGASNFSNNYLAGGSKNFYLIKADHIRGAADRFAGWYLTDHFSPNYTSVFPNPAADPRTFSNTTHHYGYGSWFHILGSNKVNGLSVTYAYRTLHTLSFGLGGDYPSVLGLRGVPENAFPRFAPSGFSALGSAQQERRQYPIKTVTILDNFSWILGRHALRFGFQGTHSSNNAILLGAISGSFKFSTLPTGLPGNSLTGSGLASLLLGFPTGFSELATEELDRRSWYLAGFVADDWTMNSRLTLNLGLRWETDTPMRDAHNRINGFDPYQVNPVSGTSGVVKFAGVSGFPTSVYSGDWRNLGPRFGFAWRPRHSNDMVVRGGYGVFYSHPFDQSNPVAATLGFSLSANLASPDNGITAPFYLRDGVPVTAAEPTLDDAFGAVPVGEIPNTAVTFFERQRRSGMSQQFNLGIEQQLSGGFVLQVAGLGNISRNLPGDNLSLNQIPSSILGAQHDSQKDRPFPQFSDVSVISPSLASSNFYAGMIRLERRFSGGFSLGASYTYSSFLANCDHNGFDTLGNIGGCYSNFYDRAADYGPAANDIHHYLVFNWVYELPIGSDRRWLANNAARHIIGGWTIANVTTIRSGPPFTVTALVNTTGAFSAGELRPNVLRDPNLPSNERSVSRWFDIGAFRQPALFRFGNEGVGTLRGPGLVSFDLSLLRNFSVHERARLEFRGELINAFNHTNLGLPGRIFGAPDFGVISSASPARVVQLGARIVF